MRELLETWQTWKNNAKASEADLAELITAAEVAKDAEPWEWAVLQSMLSEHTDLDAKQVSKLLKECRIKADLGCYPYRVEDFIPAFLKSRHYIMDFNGIFHLNGREERDAGYIQSEMLMWSKQINPPRPIFGDELVKSAFSNYIADEQRALQKRMYSKLAYDPNADKDQLTAFSYYITAEAGDDETTERNRRATEIVLRNFIYRTKNHMRQRWQHGCHLMPVLYGPQGSCKSTAIETLLSPLTDFTSSASFDIFSDNSREYELSVVPVMFFEEMAGCGKADVEKLKGAMTSPRRMLRQLYVKAGARTVVSTFIGCSNKDISTLIRDETGNRRFLQIKTPILTRSDFATFDPLAMWRSVDEDALEPPLYANADDFDAVSAVQAGQVFKSPVQVWIEEGDNHPIKATNVPSLFADYFRPWVERMMPRENRFASLTDFRKELDRLHGGELAAMIVKTKPGNVISYRFNTPMGAVQAQVHQLILTEAGRDAA